MRNTAIRVAALHLIGVSALGVLGGCASSASSTAATGSVGAATTTQTVSGAAGVGGAAAVTMVNDARSVKTDIPLKMDEAWVRLMSAYEAMGIKITDIDVAAHALGNPGLRARRRIGDTQLRTALNCGGESSNPNAESFDLTLSFRSTLSPTTTGVQLETYIRGTGVNALTNNGNYVQCYSQGVIEKKIADLVTNGVPKKP